MASQTNNPYAYADQQIELLKNEVNAEFQNSSLMPFDEINLIRVKKVKSDTNKLYARLRAYHEKMCEQVLADAYAVGVKEAVDAGYEKPKKKMNVTAAAGVLLFTAYSAVTQYQYKSEVTRKAERCAQAVIAAETRQAVREAYNQAGRVWFRQAKQYVDLSVDEGRTKAFEDAGVQNVRWVTEHDERVCRICRARDGVVYPIGKIPGKHQNCRCHVVPVPMFKP